MKQKARFLYMSLERWAQRNPNMAGGILAYGPAVLIALIACMLLSACSNFHSAAGTVDAGPVTVGGSVSYHPATK